MHHTLLARIESINHFLYLAALAAGHHGLHVLAAGSLAFIVLLSFILSLRTVE